MDQTLVAQPPPGSAGRTKSQPTNPMQSKLTLPSPPSRNGHLSLDVFSPVNENGSFEFDRVLKSGKVYRRTKNKHAFIASWKPAYLVLRPNLLSVYKDEEATRLRLSINLSDVTAIAAVRHPGSTREHVFGIFTPSKNYRFQALSQKDVEDWIARIRAETPVDETEEAFLALTRNRESRAAPKLPMDDTTGHSDVDALGSTNASDFRRPFSPGPRKNFLYVRDCSANDATSFSEWSDGPASSTRPHSAASFRNLSTPVKGERQLPSSSTASVLRDPERVVCQGYLQCLRLKGGVRQWKRLWVVVRPKSLSFYKDEQEYSAVKIIPMSQVIDAAEIDPISRSKAFCFQIIAEEKPYRLCAPNEEALTKWLGSLKSIIVARKKLNPAATTPQ